ncbi:MAG: D-alanyl-D-alanine carboxypeptidase family protein [Roseburia sp.]
MSPGTPLHSGGPRRRYVKCPGLSLCPAFLQSANEVANALAERFCAGGIDAFAEKMNEKAAELGCTDSHFANPSGLNDPNHYVSAYDMALIAKAAFNNPTFVEVDSTTYYDVPAGKLKQYPDGWRYYAHHRMLRRNDSLYYDGAIGGKTGYTLLAGNTLVTCAERDGMKLIAVVLNGHQTHYSDTKHCLTMDLKISSPFRLRIRTALTARWLMI